MWTMVSSSWPPLDWRTAVMAYGAGDDADDVDGYARCGNDGTSCVAADIAGADDDDNDAGTKWL